MRIALLDDDRSQADLIRGVLLSAGHVCDLRDVLEMRDDGYDLLIAAWPTNSQRTQILRQARERQPAVLPVLLIVNRSAEDDIVAGLANGGDDYLVKPIRRNELSTRVQVLLRRAYPARSMANYVQFAQYRFALHTGCVTLDGIEIDLTQKEFELALLLFRNLGRPLSRAFIQEAVWAPVADMPSRTLDTHISRVRNKLGLRVENGFRLVPVYSYGYLLEQVAHEAPPPPV